MNEELIEHRIRTVERSVSDIHGSLKSMQKSVACLPAIEEHIRGMHEDMRRGTQRMDGHADRIRAIETDLPTLRLTSKWVISGVLGILGIVGAGVLAMVMNS